MDKPKSLRNRGFTLIEVLVVVAIMALLLGILMPSLSAARRQARSAICLTNLRSQGQITQIYLYNNRDWFPVRTATSATGGGSVFGAFEPSRLILKAERRPIEILTCPLDTQAVRDYPVGDEQGTDPNSLGIGTFYGLPPDRIIRYSYGLNNMTGIKPTTPSEKQIFNNKASAYKYTSRTLLYADCAWVNARAHDKTLNDAPKLKGRVANAGAPHRMDKLAGIPDDCGTPNPRDQRHPKGQNILFFDHHAEPVSQEARFSKVLYSYSER